MMRDEEKTKEQLLTELFALRSRLDKLETQLDVNRGSDRCDHTLFVESDSSEDDFHVCKQKELEERVAARTAELLAANAALKLEVAHRQEAEAALQKSERLYRTLIDNFPNGSVLLFDHHLRYLLVGGMGLEQTTLHKDELHNKTIWEVLPPEVCDIVEPLYRNALAGVPSTQEYSFQDRFYEIHTLPVRNEHGLIFAGMVMTQDITERKRAEESLRQSERQFRSLFNNALDAVLIVDDSRRYVDANPAACALLGLTRDQFLERRIEDIVDTDLHPVIEEAWQSFLVEGKQRGEMYLVRSDGSRRYVQFSSKANFVPGRHLSSLHDMSDAKHREAERQQAEEEREQLLEKLASEKALSQAILQQMPAGVLIAEAPSGRLIFGNAQTEKIFRSPFLPSSNIEEYRQWQAFHLDGQPYEPQDLPLARSITTGEVITEEEILIVRGDGTEGVTLVNSAPVRNREGQIVAGVAAFYDISVAKQREAERKRAEAERDQLLIREQEARRHAEAASRTKDEFLAIVSHELRSPLNAILGWSKLLRTRKLDPVTANRAIESIERNAQAQTQLIEDLLDISSIIRGKVRLYTHPVNLLTVVEAAIDTVRPTADNKGIAIEFHPASSEEQQPLLVSGDADRLQQIVWNLLTNAVKFTPTTGKVIVKLEKVDCGSGDEKQSKQVTGSPAAYSQLTVTDTGKGISSDFLPYVFDRFRQAESATTRTHGGLGLGLAIVRNLVEMHGGTIWAESLGQGQGATFVVQLPLLRETAQPSEELPFQSASASVQHPAPLQGLQVLVVDDEFDTREILAATLEQYGASVTTAESSLDAMRLLAQVQPDVLLSDIGMPDEDGYHFISQVRALTPDQGGQIPAAALTAYVREEDRQKAIAAGFQMHVAKPIEPTELIRVVATLAGREFNKKLDHPQHSSHPFHRNYINSSYSRSNPSG